MFICKQFMLMKLYIPKRSGVHFSLSILDYKEEVSLSSPSVITKTTSPLSFLSEYIHLYVTCLSYCVLEDHKQSLIWKQKR